MSLLTVPNEILLQIFYSTDPDLDASFRAIQISSRIRTLLAENSIFWLRCFDKKIVQQISKKVFLSRETIYTHYVAFKQVIGSQKTYLDKLDALTSYGTKDLVKAQFIISYLACKHWMLNQGAETFPRQSISYIARLANTHESIALGILKDPEFRRFVLDHENTWRHTQDSNINLAGSPIKPIVGVALEYESTAHLILQDAEFLKLLHCYCDFTTVIKDLGLKHPLILFRRMSVDKRFLEKINVFGILDILKQSVDAETETFEASEKAKEVYLEFFNHEKTRAYFLSQADALTQNDRLEYPLKNALLDIGIAFKVMQETEAYTLLQRSVEELVNTIENRLDPSALTRSQFELR